MLHISVCVNFSSALLGSNNLQIDLLTWVTCFFAQLQCCAFAEASHHDVTLLWRVYVLETDSFVVQATSQDLKDCGFDCWETSIGGPGVQQHSPLSVKEDILEVLKHY